MDSPDDEMVGKVGRITLGITPDHAGEVVLPVRGGTEAFTACSDEPIAKYSRVVVVECLTGRTVSVTPVVMTRRKEATMFFWHVPAPNEALLISGSRRRAAGHPVPDRDRPRLLRPAHQAEGALPLAVAAGGRDRRGLHHHPGHPPPHPRHRRLQGGRRPGLDRQRRAAFPGRAGPHGGAGRAASSPVTSARSSAA